MIIPMASGFHLRFVVFCGLIGLGLGVWLVTGLPLEAASPVLHNALPSEEESPDNQPTEIPNGLRKTIPLWVQQVGMEKVLADLSKNTGLDLVVNWKALDAAGVNKNSPVTLHLPTPLLVETILTLVCQDAGTQQGPLGWVVKDGVVHVSTKEDLQSSEYQVVRIYDIKDLVKDLVDRDPRTPMSYDDRVKQIITIITSTIAPDSWRDAGGTIGTLRELNGLLIINQTEQNHWAIKKVLAQYRDKDKATHK